MLVVQPLQHVGGKYISVCKNTEVKEERRLINSRHMHKGYSSHPVCVYVCLSVCY